MLQMPEWRYIWKSDLRAWLVLFAGLIATTYASHVVSDIVEREAQRDFISDCSDVTSRIYARLETHRQVLLGAVALFDASESVERNEWHDYAKRMRIDKHFNGIQGLGFSLLIPRKQLARHIAEIRKQGFPEYTVRPAGERDIYSSIIYLEPFEGRNLRAFGYDMYSEPVRRAAMEQARDENVATLSGKVVLVQETEKDVQAGTLMFKPVYRKSMPTDTVEQRRAALFGWVYSPFRMNDLLNGILQGKHSTDVSHLHLKVYDGQSAHATSLLYDSEAEDKEADIAPQLFRREQFVDFNGRVWTLHFTMVGGRTAGIDYSRAWGTFAAGLAGSFMLFFLTLSYLHTRRNANRIAQELTSELQDRVATERELNTRLELQSTAMNTSANAIVITNKAGVIELVNPAFGRLTGYDLDEAIGHKPSELVKSGKQSKDFYEQLWQTILSGKAWHGELVNHRKDGSEYNEEMTITPLTNEQGEVTHFVAVKQDISERKHAEQTQKKFARALTLLSKCNTVLVHAEDEQEILANICRLTVEVGGYLFSWVGYTEHDAAKSVRPVAQSGFEEGYLDSINITWADTERGRGPTGTAIRTGMTVVNQDVLSNPSMLPWREAAIKRGYQSSVALPLVCDKRVLGALTIYSAEPNAFVEEEVALLEELAGDLAYGIETLRTRLEHEAAKNELEFLAHHDPLTSLPNRLLLRDRFDQAAALAHRERSDVAVLFLDLDNFKQINDSLGHSIGDRLLVRVVERLRGCIRETDTISRQGGDEFVILLSSTGGLDAIEAIAHNIIESFVDPFEINGFTMNASFSIGISLFPDDSKDFDTLLKQADTALYQAKDAGRNTYRFFTEKMNIDALEHMQLQGQLRNAIRQQEFLLYYQPQIDTLSGHITGAEALVRWQHPELGLIPPGRFIPLAERSGMIIPIGEWVLNEACRQAQLWRETHQPAIVIAVNLSALQFKRGDIVKTVTEALARSGLPASHLELELTESILLHDIDVAMDTLQRLKGIGVKLSIDDFGTGYSSLSYLKRLKVDKLKIDQSFVRDMVQDSDDAAIVKAIVQLGHTLQLTVIAEGVENDDQLALLRRYGCDAIQGYLFSRPVPALDFVAFYQR